jgi:hypothetical protein
VRLVKCHPEVCGETLRTIAELIKELGAVRLVNKVHIKMLRSAEKRVTRSEDERAEQVY